MITFAFILSLIVVVVRLGLPNYFIPGFTSIIIILMIFGGLQLFCLGIVGEYVGRIYEESKKRPIYLLNTVIQRESELGSDLR